MRAVGVALSLAVVLVIPPVAGPAMADEARTPSRQEVRDARAAAQDKARDVATVQAELASANALLQESAVAAARATEAWNGARYRLDQARQAAAAAQDRAGIARTDVSRQQSAYADALVSSYEMSPALAAVSSIVQADGIGAVVEQTTTMQATESALDTRYDGFVAASTLAGVAVDQAAAAEAEAAALQVEARAARDAASRAAEAAAAEAQAVATRKDALIRELADLQDISVALAEERQADLEQRAAEAAAEAAAQAAAAEQEEEQDQQPAPQQPAPEQPAPEQPEPQQPEPQQPEPAAALSRATRAQRRGQRRDLLRPRPARRALPLGRRRPGRLGLLRPHDGRLGCRRHLAASLLRGPVRAVDTDLRQQPAGRRPRVLGVVEQPVVDLPRRALHRRRPDHPRPAHRSSGDAGVDVLLDDAELLRPTLTHA